MRRKEKEAYARALYFLLTFSPFIIHVLIVVYMSPIRTPLQLLLPSPQFPKARSELWYEIVGYILLLYIVTRLQLLWMSGLAFAIMFLSYFSIWSYIFFLICDMFFDAVSWKSVHEVCILTSINGCWLIWLACSGRFRIS